MEKSNKHSGTEDSLGKLHGLVSRAFGMKVQNMLDMVEAGGDPDEWINTRDLQAAAKWVEQNGIGCAPADDKEGSELKEKLDAIRSKQAGKVIQFADNG